MNFIETCFIDDLSVCDDIIKHFKDTPEEFKGRGTVGGTGPTAVVNLDRKDSFEDRVTVFIVKALANDAQAGTDRGVANPAFTGSARRYLAIVHGRRCHRGRIDWTAEFRPQ